LDCCEFPDFKPLKTILENSRKRKSPFPRNYGKRLRLSNLVPEPKKLVPVSRVAAATLPKKDEHQFWFDEYENKDIVSLDCEMVSLLEKDRGKHKMKAATVSVVDFDGIEIYSVNYDKDICVKFKL
jgi:hypothetical protein